MVNDVAGRQDLIPTLLRGEPEPLRGWLEGVRVRRFVLCVLAIMAGAALYGASIGSWRSPKQALFTAIKFPLVLLVTSAGNAMLNALLAPLLGVALDFRQAVLAILISQAVAAIILGAFSPLVAFIVWNLPTMSEAVSQYGIFAFLQVSQAAVIAFAGVTAVAHLYRLLRSLGPDERSARNLLVAWLVGNLLLGSQLAWICRPFFGSPFLEVQLLRREALKGNFFEAIAFSIGSFFR